MSGQPFCASTWSQTVSVWAFDRLALADAVATTTESATATTASARTRYLIPNLPRFVDARAGRAKCPWPEDLKRPAVRRVVYTNRPRVESPTQDHSCQEVVTA